MLDPSIASDIKKRVICGTEIIKTLSRRALLLFPERTQFFGIHQDGWLSPNAMVLVGKALQGSELIITLCSPEFLPFIFPTRIEAVFRGLVIANAKIDGDGYHQLQIPITETGIIELRADQWFVPAQLRTECSDERSLSFRVSAITFRVQQVKDRVSNKELAKIDGENSSFSPYHLLRQFKDGWMPPAAVLQVDRTGADQQLKLHLELPKALPIIYPLTLRILKDGILANTIRLKSAGEHHVLLSLQDRALFELKADQAFEPALVGLQPSDIPAISYRLAGASFVEEKNASYEILDAIDGWIGRRAAVRIHSTIPHSWLVLKLEVPGWLPFTYPLEIRTSRRLARCSSSEYVPKAGFFTIKIPFKKGLVRINTDQAIANKEIFGMSRSFSCRILETSISTDSD